MNILKTIRFFWFVLFGQFTKYANPADEWSGADLTGVARGGLINEDVMAEIWQINQVPLPFFDRCGQDSIDNALYSWTIDELAVPDLANAAIDGVDSVGNDAIGGSRVNNHAQISTKNVSVTTRARGSDTIGRSDELAYQVSQRQKELRRDMEAIVLGLQASVADDGDTVAGKVGALASWIETNAVLGGTSTIGGYDPATGLTDAPVPGTALPITESDIRDLVEAVYNEGGESHLLMAMPTVIRKISEYMFTDAARVATLQSDQGKSREAAAALGSVNFFITDFGSLELVPNRIQQVTAAGISTAYILDMALLRTSMLVGYRTEPLAKTGLADKRLMSCDWGFKCLNEKGQAMIMGIDNTAAMLGTPV